MLMGITWRLWMHINQARVPSSVYKMYNPVPIQDIDERAKRRLLMRKWALRLVLFLIAFGLIVTDLWGLVILVAVSIMFASPLIFLSFGFVAGSISSMRTNRLITLQYETNRYEQIGATARGAASIHWFGCLVSFRSSGALVSLRQVVRILSTLVILIVLVFGGFFYAALVFDQTSLTTPPAEFLANLVLVFSVALGLYFDFIQSILLGSLVGSIVPIWVRERFGSQGFTLILFWLFQFLSYGIIWAFVIDGLSSIAGQADSNAIILMHFFRLFVFFIVRDILIAILWMILSLSLRCSLKELTEILQV